MCHTPTLMNINWRLRGHFLIISSHILSSWYDCSIAYGGPFSSQTCGAKLLFSALICLGLFYCNIDQRWPWSTLSRLTSIFCINSDFRTPYRWALKSRNSGLFDRSPSLLRWLFWSWLHWIFCVVPGSTCIDLWWTVFEGCGSDTWKCWLTEKDFVGWSTLLTAVTPQYLISLLDKRNCKSDLYLACLLLIYYCVLSTFYFQVYVIAIFYWA